MKKILSIHSMNCICDEKDEFFTWQIALIVDGTFQVQHWGVGGLNSLRENSGCDLPELSEWTVQSFIDYTGASCTIWQFTIP